VTRLVVWVEGDRDSRFFESIVKPRLLDRYTQVLVREYRQEKQATVNRLLRAMVHQGYDRLFVADINSAPCVTSRKEKVKEHYQDLKDNEIIVVSREIESWYLAGLNASGASALKVNCPAVTDDFSKLDFNRLRPDRFNSEVDFMIELLKHFDPMAASKRNASFAYFHRRFLAPQG